MIKVLGILLLVATLYLLLLASQPAAWSLSTHQMLGRQTATWGILVLGVAPLIIVGGIDLSLGSALCLSAAGYALCIKYAQIPPGPAAVLILLAAPLLGLAQGLLVTKLHIQPFLATLFGLFIFRGAARYLAEVVQGTQSDVNLSGIPWDINELAFLVNDPVPGLGVPWILVVFLALAALVGFVLHATVHGRYLYAIGANEQAARYAGIATDRYKIMAYMWSSAMAGLAGIFFMLEIGSVNPANSANAYELFAITGAVVGGCSLRGGEGNICGIILGASVIPLLRILPRYYRVPDVLEYVLVGVALLLGTIVDELLKRRKTSRT